MNWSFFRGLYDNFLMKIKIWMIMEIIEIVKINLIGFKRVRVTKCKLNFFGWVCKNMLNSALYLSILSKI
jgi:hypothetical protein